MNAMRERSISLWMDEQREIVVSRLASNTRADTVVVGAGITGLSVAYELVAAGQDVIVLDRGRIGMGMTSRTTAHLSSISDDDFHSLIERRGADKARLFYDSHSAAIDR